MVSITPRLEISFSSHREFHLYYLTKHSSMGCRRLHLIGTAVAVIGSIIGALVGRSLFAALASVAAGVGICWVGDYSIQKTTPTTFKYPLWSAASNFKMVWAMLRGDMSI